MSSEIKLKGRIVAKYPLSKTKKQDFVISFILAKFFSKGKQQKFELVFFKDLAQKASESLFKGDLIEVRGVLGSKQFLAQNKTLHKTFIKVKSYERLAT